MALSEPVTYKSTNSGGDERLAYAASAMQGYRVQMEDAHVTMLQLHAATQTSFFAVYDGHGGPAVAKFCQKHLHAELLKHEEFQTNLPNALQSTFLRMDVLLRDKKAAKELCKHGGNEQWKKYKRDRLIGFVMPCQKPAYEGPVGDGCTACVALIRGNHIIVANAGDSRCVLSRKGQATDLSRDHKPNVPAETQRIEHAGHNVTVTAEKGNVPRIDEGIAIARAIGDLGYKDNTALTAEEQAVTAFPDVRTEEINDDAEFMIIACDGIWDCMTSQEVVDYVRLYLNKNNTLSYICESLLQHCVLQPRGRDNMSVVLVRFKNNPVTPESPPDVVLPRDIRSTPPNFVAEETPECSANRAKKSEIQSATTDF
ncbi:hypothetical protein ACP70R_009916 [Stipagrostis hirtigluma subsp. patula]